MKHIVNWYRRQSRSSRVVLGCALLVGVFALYGLGSAAKQSLAMVATPTVTPTPAITPTATPSSTPTPTNSANPFSGQPWLTHQAASNAWTQQTLPKSSATSVNKVWLHTTPTPQGTAAATATPAGATSLCHPDSPTDVNRSCDPNYKPGTATPPPSN